MHRIASLLLGLLLHVALAACGSPGSTAYVDLPEPAAASPALDVARTVGELLTTDTEASAAAERRLLALDSTGRERLAAQAERIPTERDPRWLHVLDEQRLLPALDAEQRTAFLLWKARRPERFFAMKAQAGLVEQARQNPRPLYDVLVRGGPDTELVAVALAVAQRHEAAEPLLARYVASEQESERRALAEALLQLKGEASRLRASAPLDERQREAARLRALWARPLEAPRD